MGKSDKIVFWVIEAIIIVIVLIYAYNIWEECHILPENYVPQVHGGNIWSIRIYRLLPEVCLTWIFIGSMMNISALFTAKLNFFSELSWISKIFARIYAAIVGLIASYVILLVIHWIYTRC